MAYIKEFQSYFLDADDEWEEGDEDIDEDEEGEEMEEDADYDEEFDEEI